MADDHRALRLLFAKKLRAAGHETITVESGAEAIHEAEEVEPDIIVLDVMMPGMTGYEACKIIKQTPRLSNTPVILYSADETKEFQEMGKQAGADACIQKTSKSSDLLLKIEEFLAVKKARAVEPDEPSEQGGEAVGPLIVDVDRFTMATTGDKLLMETLINMFSEETTRQLSMLQEALGNGDLDGVLREAHSIKGAAGNLGFMEIDMIARELETLARSGQMDGLPTRLSQLTEALNRLNKKLKALNLTA